MYLYNCFSKWGTGVSCGISQHKQIHCNPHMCHAYYIVNQSYNSHLCHAYFWLAVTTEDSVVNRRPARIQHMDILLPAHPHTHTPTPTHPHPHTHTHAHTHTHTHNTTSHTTHSTHTHTLAHTHHTHITPRALTELIDMRGKPIDEALRQFQQVFRMPVRVWGWDCVWWCEGGVMCDAVRVELYV